MVSTGFSAVCEALASGTTPGHAKTKRSEETLEPSSERICSARTRSSSGETVPAMPPTTSAEPMRSTCCFVSSVISTAAIQVLILMSLRQRQYAMQRNPNPRGTIVQFIDQLIECLIENIDVQEQVEGLVLCENNEGIPSRPSIGARKLARN